MIVRFDASVLQLDGTPHKNEKGEPITYRDICTMVLTAAPKNEPVWNTAATEKVHRWELAKAIYRAGPDGCDLRVEDVAILKKLIGEAFPPAIVGPVYELLDPPAEAVAN